METTTNQSKALTWGQRKEQECIALGFKRGNKTGCGAIISPRLCEKLKQAEEKKRKSKSTEEKEQ